MHIDRASVFVRLAALGTALAVTAATAMTGTVVEGRTGRSAPERHVNVDLHVGATASGVFAGLHIAIERGWHTYWINPGDTGSAPHIVWTTPKGVTVGAMSWPAPERIASDGVVAYGYTGHVVLVARIAGDGPLASALGAIVDLVSCRDRCVLEHISIARASPWPERGPAGLSMALAHIAQPMPTGWRARASCTGETLTLTIDGPRNYTNADFFPSVHGVLDGAPPSTHPTPTGIALDIGRSPYRLNRTTPLEGSLTIAGSGAFTIVALVDTSCSSQS